VLGWRAAEVAELLGTSTAAVNGVLQRARARLEQVAPEADEMREPADPDALALLGRYAAAFENADMTALTELLHDDAVLEMPPLPTWFAGRDLVLAFLGARVLGQPGDFRLIPTAANGQPALAGYIRDREGPYRAHAVQVLTLAGSSGGVRGRPPGPALRVSRIVSFNDPALVTTFGLPQVLRP
jgi:RNA polymerase sigma-70 factor (ECF subfamily)